MLGYLLFKNYYANVGISDILNLLNPIKLSLYIMQNSHVVDTSIYQEDTNPEATNQLNEQLDKKVAIRDRINKFLNLYKA